MKLLSLNEDVQFKRHRRPRADGIRPEMRLGLNQPRVCMLLRETAVCSS